MMSDTQIETKTDSRCIAMIWFEPDAPAEPGKRGRFQVVETEMPDFATLCEMIDGDRLIGGAVLHTRKQADGTTLITGRRPIAFRGSAALRVELAYWRFVEEA